MCCYERKVMSEMPQEKRPAADVVLRTVYKEQVTGSREGRSDSSGAKSLEGTRHHREATRAGHVPAAFLENGAAGFLQVAG